MNRKEPTSQVILKFVIAVIIAIYVLFPFALVVINSCKQTADITSNPIGLNGMSIGQLMKNMNDVVNNPNFLFFVILACVSILQVRISNKKEVEL